MRMTLFFAISLLLLVGCQTTSSVYCEVTKPITYSRNDAVETRDQITEHNAVYEELCGD